MAIDWLVVISGGRYSVPGCYVGESVVIREVVRSYDILHEGIAIVRYQSVGRQQVVQEPAHYVASIVSRRS